HASTRRAATDSAARAWTATDSAARGSAAKENTDEAERARGAPGNRPPGGAGALRRVVQRGPDGVGQPVRRARFLRLVRLLAGTNRRGDRPAALGHRGPVRGESVVAHRQRDLAGSGGPEREPGGAGGVLRRDGHDST